MLQTARNADVKAIQFDRFGDADVLQYVDVEDPAPGVGQVLIKTSAIGVNFPDIQERLGVYNQADTRVGGVALPRITGMAVTGTVTATGDHSGEHLMGKRVVALMKYGAYAQYAVADLPLTVIVPEDADVVALAGIAAQSVCAYLLLQASTRLTAGESLLVHGAAGGVGGAAVQIAKALGAIPVIGTASTQQRREYVRLGADAAISYGDPNWTDEVR
jgi:NADPH:quinone reductase